MQRREFIGLIGASALSFPRPGYAQTKTAMPLVGFLLPFKPDTTVAKDRIAAIRKGLQEEGFIESTNYSLAVRFAEGDINRYPQLATELGALNARVIVVSASLYGMDEFRRAFPELPLVVTAIAADLVALGPVDSKDSLLSANQIQGFFWGGGLGCDGSFGFERRGLGADGAPDYRSA